MNKGGRIVLSVASIVVIGAGIKLASPLLVPVLVASFIAIVTAPLVMWLCDHGVPRFVAVLSGLLLDVAAGAALGFPLAAAVATFTARSPCANTREAWYAAPRRCCSIVARGFSRW